MDIFFAPQKENQLNQHNAFSRKSILALGACILLMLSSAIGQTRLDTSAVGDWLGAIEFGGAKFRLVFHVIMTDSSRLTGTVDSPDKGVKGIPLSSVYVNGDSLVFAVSAASACYEGKYANAKLKIEGIWKEGGTDFSMTLNRTIDTIESKANFDYSRDDGVRFDSEKTSQHFDLHSSHADSNALDDIANVLEENYSRVTDHLQVQLTKKIRVYIYPDTKTFHAAIFMPDAPDWVVGAGGFNELKMVSPLNPGSVHTYASLMQAIVHELVHAAVLNARGERGLAGLPKWLNEGYAFFEAHQMTDEMRKSVTIHSFDATLPTWAQLDTVSVVEFGNINGYALSTTIIEFLVNTYGFDKVVKLIRAPENMDDIYGTPGKDLEKQWIHYLQRK